MPSIKDITLRENGNILASYYSGIYEFDGSNWFEWMIQGFDQGYRDVTAVHVTDKGTVLAGGCMGFMASGCRIQGLGLDVCGKCALV